MNQLQQTIHNLSNHHDFGSLSSADNVDTIIGSLKVAHVIHEIEKNKMELSFAKMIAKQLKALIKHTADTYSDPVILDEFGVQPHWAEILIDDLSRELDGVNEYIKELEELLND